MICFNFIIVEDNINYNTTGSVILIVNKCNYPPIYMAMMNEDNLQPTSAPKNSSK